MSEIQVGQINSTDGSTAITTGAGGTVELSAALTGTDATLSGGVYLGGTGSANYLTDYEEGTFTLTFDTIYGGSPDFTTTIPWRYVKTGSIVTCEFSASINGSNSVVVDDRFSFTGLPFNAQTDQRAQGMSVIHASYGGGRGSFWNGRPTSDGKLLVWCFQVDGAITYGDGFYGTLVYEVA